MIGAQWGKADSLVQMLVQKWDRSCLDVWFVPAQIHCSQRKPWTNRTSPVRACTHSAWLDYTACRACTCAAACTHACVWGHVLTWVDLYRRMTVYNPLPHYAYTCPLLCTYVHSWAHMSAYMCTCGRMSIHVHTCQPSSTHVPPCQPMPCHVPPCPTMSDVRFALPCRDKLPRGC